MRDFCHVSSGTGHVTNLYSTTQHRWFEVHRSQLQRLAAWLVACVFGTLSTGLLAADEVAPPSETTTQAEWVADSADTVRSADTVQTDVNSAQTQDTAESHDGLAWWSSESTAPANEETVEAMAPATTAVQPAAATALQEPAVVILRAPSHSQRSNVQLTSYESNDTSGLMWWSTSGQMDNYAAPPVMNNVSSSFQQQPDSALENKALEALDQCSPGYGKLYDDVDDPALGFFKPLNMLNASGVVRKSRNQEDQALLKVPDNCAERYFAEFPAGDRTNPIWEDRTPEGMNYCFCHKPLYFEDANLERCGYIAGKDCCCAEWCPDWCGCCCCHNMQNVVSAAYFFGTIPLLPYKMTVNCPCECVPALGRCPDGCRYSCRENYLPPWDWHAAAVEAAAVTGVIFLIP